MGNTLWKYNHRGIQFQAKQISHYLLRVYNLQSSQGFFVWGVGLFDIVYFWGEVGGFGGGGGGGGGGEGKLPPCTLQ